MTGTMRAAVCGLVFLGALGLRAEAVAGADEGARNKLIGRWDATPTIDEDMLDIDPGRGAAIERASAIGTRGVYVFQPDGVVQFVLFSRVGPELRNEIDRLVPAVTAGKWELVEVKGNKTTVRVTPERGKPVTHTLVFADEDHFTIDVSNLLDKNFPPEWNFRRSGAERAIRWVRDNNSMGKDSQIVGDMARLIGEAARARKDLSISFGPDLTSSGKPVQIQMLAEQLFVLPYTPTQAEQLGLKGGTVAVVDSGAEHFLPVLVLPAMSKLEFDGGSRLDLGKPITGRVTIGMGERLGAGEYSLRLWYRVGKDARILFQPLMSAPNGGGMFKFSFKPQPKDAAYKGPVTVFVDLCRTTKYASGGFDTEILAPAAARVMDAGGS